MYNLQRINKDTWNVYYESILVRDTKVFKTKKEAMEYIKSAKLKQK